MPFRGGSGTANDPFLIATKDDFLEFIANAGNYYYRQIADIDLEGVNFTPVSSFPGTYNGGYFKLLNLSNPLFEVLSGKVSNLKIVSANISSSDMILHVGIIAGTCDGGILERVGIYDSILSVPEGAIVGSLIGSLQNNGIIKECFAKNTQVDGYTYVGGLIGKIISPAEVTDSYFIGTVETHAPKPVAGGFTASVILISNSTLVFDRCYAYVSELKTILNENTNDFIGHISFINLGSGTEDDYGGDVNPGGDIVYPPS